MKLRSVFPLAFALAAFALSGAAQADPVLEKLAKDKNCVTCHTVDKPGPFPNHKKIADKYRGEKDQEAVVKRLVDKVMKGGSGTFGALPMPANAQVNKEDAEKLVRWMLSAK